MVSYPIVAPLSFFSFSFSLLFIFSFNLLPSFFSSLHEFIESTLLKILFSYDIFCVFRFPGGMRGGVGGVLGGSATLGGGGALPGGGARSDLDAAMLQVVFLFRGERDGEGQIVSLPLGSSYTLLILKFGIYTKK